MQSHDEFDALVAALRNRAVHLDPESQAAVDRILTRLKAWDSVATRHSSQSGVETAMEPGDLDFLSPAAGPDEIGRLGHYAILSVLGAGGMGIVLKARDTQLNRIVAVKVVKPGVASSSAGRRFLREAQAAAGIKDDRIVTIHHVGEERSVPFLAMELLEGESLDARLGREGSLGISEALRIGREITEGLAASHAQGLIHRDIKPGNIWLEGDKARVKILDFGLARLADDDARLSKPGAIIGTPGYMAPEQARGEKVDERADLFSLGCVLYRMVTGRLPFRGGSTLAVLMSLGNDQPEAPRRLCAHVPSDLSDLIMRLLEKDAVRRPVSANAVLEELTRIERCPSVLGIGQTPVEANRRSGAGAYWLAAIAIAMLFIPFLAYSGTILRFVTNRGELIIDVQASDVIVSVEQHKLTIIDKTTKRHFTLEAGDGEVHVFETDGLRALVTKSFTLNRGGKTIVAVTNAEIAGAKPKPVPEVPTPQAKSTTPAPPKVEEPRPGEAFLAAEFKHPKHVYSVVYSAKLKQFIAGGGGNEHNVRFYDPEKLAEVGKLQVPGNVNAMAIDREGTTLVAAGELRVEGKPVIQVIDPVAKQILKNVPISTPSLHTIALALNGQSFAWNDGQNVPKQRGTIKVAEWQKDRIREIGATTNAVRPLVFSPDGRFLRVNEHDSSNSAYDLLEEEPKAPSSRNYNKCAFSPDGRYLAFNNGHIKNYTRISSGTAPYMVLPIARLGFPEDSKESRQVPVFSPSSKLIGLGFINHVIRIYETKAWKQHAMMRTRPMACFAISDDDRYVAVASPEGIVQIWKINPP